MCANSSKSKLTKSEAGKLGALAALETHKQKRLRNVEEYEKTPKLCETCKLPLSYANRHQQYCSRSCAATKNNIGIRRHGSPPADCLYCNKRLTKGRQKFCSVFCQKEKEQKDRITKVLENKNFDGVSNTPSTVKKILLIIKGHKCEICGITMWRDQPVPLVMDHINGNPEDNTLDNLRLVCGNCNMQLPTFTSKNRGNGRAFRRQRYLEKKSY